jgi:DNA polymerase/3'-5' exonuclease PolX
MGVENSKRARKLKSLYRTKLWESTFYYGLYAHFQTDGMVKTEESFTTATQHFPGSRSHSVSAN